MEREVGVAEPAVILNSPQRQFGAAVNAEIAPDLDRRALLPDHQVFAQQARAEDRICL